MKFRISAMWILLCCLALTSWAQEMSSQTPATLKLSTKMVSLSVTVTDKKDKAVIGLKPEDFQIYENNIGQPLSFFSTEEAPISWGLVLDRSDSMKDSMQEVYEAALGVVNEGTEKDETFIVTFNKKVELVTAFTSDRRQLQQSIRNLQAEGGTALWDATRFALDTLKQAKHRKRVLVVITDGEDNRSLTTFKDLIQEAEETGVLIYPIALFKPSKPSRLGARSRVSPRDELTELAERTGASAAFPTTVKECQERIQAIAYEVSHQYSLGYYPSNAKSDGQWRKLKVVVPLNQVKYVARTRLGYYAPSSE